MPPRPHRMMRLLAAGSAALVLFGCGSPNQNQDPSATPVPQVAQTAAALRAPKEGEKITASVYAHNGEYNSAVATSFQKEVKSIEQCVKFGQERIYMLGSTGRITCSGEDEAPLARYNCRADTATCTSVLKY